jgi:hypothetical protein
MRRDLKATFAPRYQEAGYRRVIGLLPQPMGVDALSRPPRPSASRSSAEARYRETRRLAFQQAQEELADAGIGVDLRSIDAAAMEAFSAWPPRRVAWPWPDLAADWRKGHPDRFDLAVWSDGALCALAMGRPAPKAPHMSLHYMEANPDPVNPLRRRVAAVVVTSLQAYAMVLGKRELRLIDPLPAVVPFYCSTRMGFTLVTPRGEAPYCRRSI